MRGIIEYHTIPVTINVEIRSDDIDDIMVAALEGGINYWCGKAEVVGEYLGEYASEQISHGGALRLYDIEDNSVYDLNLDNFLEGVKSYIAEQENPPLFFGNRLDVSSIDADAADTIIQYALFGEIVYG